MQNEIKPMEQMVAERSEFGAKKYQVPNPDPTGPWGDGETAELFWFRDLSQDMREELADAEVYAQRLADRMAGEVVSGDVRCQVDILLSSYRWHVAVAYVQAALLGGLLEREIPELVTDWTEHWGQFSKRL